MRKKNETPTENELEAAFKKACDEVYEQIQSKLAAASALINEAVELSDQYGVPFCPREDIMWCSPSYVPESFEKKFKGIDYDFVYDLTEAGGGDTGWQTSQTC